MIVHAQCTKRMPRWDSTRAMRAIGVREGAIGNMYQATYNLAFFFGPGLPLTLGVRSPPKATVELLLTPFFFTPSDGGGIDEFGVPTAAGVLAADSEGFPPCELATIAMVSEVVGEETSLKGDSSFTRASGSNLASLVGDSLRVTRRGVLEGFRRTEEAVAGDFAEPMAMGGR